MSEINFITVDADQILNDLISQFEKAYNTTLYSGDERRIFLYQMAQVIVNNFNAINDTGRQNLLRNARGLVLDAWGERVKTPRIPAQKAYTTIRFMLSTARLVDTVIPAGYRATPDGLLYFATSKDFTIPAGQQTGDILAIAAEAGSKYNGFAPGQIKTLVDPIPYVNSIQNIDSSSGGSDIEPDDDGVNVWSKYRERIRQAPSGFSSAGPADGYAYWAKTADANIQDVAVLFPTPGHVQIVVLMKDGKLTTQATLDAVNTACNDRTRRPMTDYVTVSAPGTTAYSINFTYYISKDQAANETNIRNSIEATGGSVDQYKVWQEGKLGRAINPDYLRQLMLGAGAFRIDITTPVYAVVDSGNVPTCGAVTVNYGGLI